MIESIITEYLHANRRLVLPGMGAFLKKDDGKIVFVPFLNKDDGVLNDLVRQKYGISVTEASDLIDQYIGMVAERIASVGRYKIDALGSLKKDVNGIVCLDAEDLGNHPAAEVAAPSSPVVPAAEPVAPPKPDPQPVAPRVEAAPLREQPAAPLGRDPREPLTVADKIREQSTVRTLNDRFAPVEESAAKEPTRPAAAPPSPSASPAPAAAAKPAGETKVNRSLRTAAKKNPPTAPTPAAGGASTPSAAASTSGRPSVVPVKTPSERPVYDPAARPSPAPRKKGADWILIVAILVALVAIGVMIYAWYMVEMPSLDLG